jgi:hypothetical protein
MNQMDGYDENDSEKVEKCCIKAFQLFMAFLYLDNSDNQKYGSLLSGLQTQQSLGNNQYPKTITEAKNVLSNHRFDSVGRTRQPGSKKETDQEADKEEKLEISFVQMEGKCYCCAKGGHKLPQCRHKKKPKEEWAINVAKAKEEKAQSHAQTTAEAKTDVSVSKPNVASSNNVTTGWTGVHIH